MTLLSSAKIYGKIIYINNLPEVSFSECFTLFFALHFDELLLRLYHTALTIIGLNTLKACVIKSYQKHSQRSCRAAMGATQTLKYHSQAWFHYLTYNTQSAPN